MYLNEPRDGQPSGESVGLSFFLTAVAGVTQLARVVEERYLIDWEDTRRRCAGSEGKAGKNPPTAT